MKTLISAAGVAALAIGMVAGGSPASAAEEIKMTVASGLPPFSNGTRQLAKFALPEINKRLAEKGNYTVKWTTGWAGSIAKQFDLFEAVEGGIADIGYVNTLFEGSKLPMEQITYVTPFHSDDLLGLVKVWEELQTELPELDQQYIKHNQVRLKVYGIPQYSFMSKFPIKTLDDIKGKKFGAPGLAANWLKNTGATAVAGALSQYYNSLQTGVYDGIIMLDNGIAPFKFYEVAPHITQVNIGAMLASNLTVNKDKWESLPQEVRDITTQVVDEWQKQSLDGAVADAAKSLRIAKEKGAIIAQLPASEVKKLASSVPNVAKPWAKSIDDKGLPGTKLLNLYMAKSAAAGLDQQRAWDKE
ncbi:MAG: TRAP-type C4-dicarboxylate transport system substrate-binding protein [Alphaproteobacteria bacterium]|jgi:TRAP-type C4-dicarboxylate transport system substrate-binding protein